MIGSMIKELMQARGALDKKRVLTRYKTNPGIRAMLKYMYDPELTYGIRPSPISPMSLYDRDKPLHTEEHTLLLGLADRVYTGREAERRVEAVTSLHGPLVKFILGRNMQCGIQATTINSVMPGLIPQFKAMKALDTDVDNITYPRLAQLKYDGVRILAMNKNGLVTFKTYNGKTVNLPNLRQILEHDKFYDYTLDGELVLKGGKLEDRTSVSGMVNSAIHGGIIDETKLEYAVFDALRTSDFEACVCIQGYTKRFNNVVQLSRHHPYLTYPETNIVYSPDDVNILAEWVYSQGYEGLILKMPNHMYTYKRSKEWIKVKQIKTADLRVINIEEGKGKYQGMIGALDCTGVVEGKTVLVSVGSGLSDSQRDSNPTEYHGKTIEVKYNSLIKDSKTGVYSLFLPRFVKVRIDK